MQKAFAAYEMSLKLCPWHVRARFNRYQLLPFSCLGHRDGCPISFFSRYSLWERDRRWEEAVEDMTGVIATNDKIADAYPLPFLPLLPSIEPLTDKIFSDTYYEANAIEN